VKDIRKGLDVFRILLNSGKSSGFWLKWGGRFSIPSHILPYVHYTITIQFGLVIQDPFLLITYESIILRLLEIEDYWLKERMPGCAKILSVVSVHISIDAKLREITYRLLSM
jgi:hypothetical protein